MLYLLRKRDTKIFSFLTLRKLTTFNHFQKVLKENQALTRFSKLSLFEYFGLTDERKTAKKEEILINELFIYINSNYIEREFKYLINDKETKFKFFISHLSLLINRFELILSQKKYFI